MTATRADSGVAAVELAIIGTLFVALLGLVAPLAYLFYETLQLGRTTGDVVRFASSRTDKDRFVDTVDDQGRAVRVKIDAGRLPDAAAVGLEAKRAYTGAGTAKLISVKSDKDVLDGGCPSGRRVSLDIATTVDLGPFLGLITGSPRTLRATATSCEE